MLVASLAVSLLAPAPVHAYFADRTPAGKAAVQAPFLQPAIPDATAAQAPPSPVRAEAQPSDAVPGHGLSVASLSVEHLSNPLGVDAAQPRLSWQLASGSRDKAQTAYQIQVSRNGDSLAADAPDVWDSARVSGDAQSLVAYAGPPLSSATPYYWRVRVWDEAGTESAWSSIATWTTGLLAPGDWKADWISPASTDAGGSYLRKSFSLPEKPLRATAFVSGRGTFERTPDYQGYCCLQTATLARGIYELTANGKKVGDAELEAQPTDSRVRSLYRTWDVTSLLKAGDNAVGFLLGEDSDVILQIQVEWPSGPATVVTTDSTWTSRPGPVTRAHRFHGETFDARKQISGWDTAPISNVGWSPVRTNPARGTLSASPNEPMRVVDRLTPVKVTQPAPAVFVADFGKNVSGTVSLSQVIPAGRTVTIKHGERLLNGRVNNSVIMAAQTSTFTGDGKTSLFSSRFAYAGFRWAEISGLDALPANGSMVAQEIRNDVGNAGTFTASTPLLNSLHEANRQTQVNGMHGIPEDTPTREKRGWMADAHLAAEATINNYDMAAFYTKFVQDMEDAQKPSGFVPDIVPVEHNPFWSQQSDPAWSAATVLIPYYVWKAYGDDRLLSRHYSSMDRWMSYTATVTDGYLITRPSYTWGQDWVASEDTDSKLFQSGFYYLTAKLMAEMSAELGKAGPAEKYKTLSNNIANAFNARYFDAGKASYGNSQFSNALPLTLGIVPEGRAGDVTETLVNQVMVIGGGHVRGGLPGAKYIVDALELMDRSDIVNIVVSRTDSPGWAYMLTHGPGSIWEEWQGSPSLNHPMFTFIDNWLYKSVAGISPSEAGGYREIIFDPRITPSLPSAAGSVHTPFGEARIDWKVADRRITYNITVPVGSTGKVTLRDTAPSAVSESGQLAAAGNGIKSVSAGGPDTLLTLGSGTYHFTSDPALTELVAASNTSAAISTAVTALGASTPRLAALRETAAATESGTSQALGTYLQQEGRAPDELRSAITAARSFTAEVSLARGEGLAPATAGDLALHAASAVHQLSAAVDAGGVVVSAAAAEEHLAPGGSMDVTVTVKNTGLTALGRLSPAIELPQGWSARPTARLPEHVEPGGEARAIYSVTAPAGSPAESYPARGSVSFTRGEDTATLSSGFTIGVGNDLTAASGGLTPQILEPGGTGFAAVTLSNLQTSADRHVQVAATGLPAGWQEQRAVQAVVPAGGHTTVLVPVSASAAARGGTLELSVTDAAAGTVLATAHSLGKVRGSSDCTADTTGESCLPQSSLVLANFEGGAPTGWTAGQGASVDAGALPGDAGTGSFLGAAALRVKAVRPAASAQWREVTYSLPKPVSTGDGAALMASLQLADPVPGAAYEAKLWASDGAGHTAESVHRLAPGSWNHLVLPTVEDGLKNLSELRVGIRTTAATADATGFFLDAVKLEYGHGGRNLAAGAAVSASTSLETGGWSAANLVDSAAFSTALHRGYRSEMAGTQWIQLDLGEARSLGTVYLHPLTTPAGEEPVKAGAGMPSAPRVQVSVDGAKWTTPGAIAQRSGVAGSPLIVSFSPVDARFLRVATDDNGPDNSLSLSEVEVFGPGNTAPGAPEDRTVDQGNPATFTATAPGRPGHRLQWQRSDDAGATFQDVSGAIGTTLTVPSPQAADDGDRFRAVTVSDGSEPVNVSPAATLTVRKEPLAVTSQPEDLYLALPGHDRGKLAAAVTGAGIRLQWQSSTDSGLSWRNVAGATTSELAVSFSEGSALPSEQFRIVASNALGARVFSSAATVNAGAAPAVSASAAHAAAVAGQPIDLRVTVTGSPRPAVTWFRQQAPGAPWAEVAGETDTTLVIGPDAVTNGARYHAVAANTFGTATSDDISVSILTAAPLPPEPLGPAGNLAAVPNEQPMADTGANVSPLLPALLLLLLGGTALAVHRFTRPRGSLALSRKNVDE
ncbi:hypothetical protein TV39_14790 [Arthrobacter sp. SPG23]|nr:hypothetical protein TV39_14790 [Arthrobacter sp. SPG23]